MVYHLCYMFKLLLKVAPDNLPFVPKAEPPQGYTDSCELILCD